MEIFKQRKKTTISSGPKLRQQPKGKRQRVQAVSAVTMPQMVMPPTAKSRRRRNSRTVAIPWSAVWSVLLSPRWFSLIITSVCIYAVIAIHENENHYLTSIPVHGAESIPVEEIAAASGLAGAHVFTVDPEKAASKIGELPGVMSATVTLKWPNEVAINVMEYQPVAIWEQTGELYWLLADGHLIAARFDKPELLHIISESSTPVGEFDFVPLSALAGAQQLQTLRPNITQLYYRPSGGLSYQDGRGWRAYFGTGTDMEQKLVVYETIVDELMKKEFQPTYISVDNQDKPFYSGQQK